MQNPGKNQYQLHKDILLLDSKFSYLEFFTLVLLI